MAEDTVEQKAAKRDRIRAAWETYRREGAGVFDWDYDSRDLMDELTEAGTTRAGSAVP
jgi:hypothetical protein